MPIFDFKCDSCGAVFEELVASSDSPAPCPKCKSEKTKKLVSGFATNSSSSNSAPSCGSAGCGSGFS